ncbi:YeeE/YedE family protein [Achromobacter denitrificans]|uniref:YeeE/YedE family protein n=1 Tax=Achromobacter denitrificans TaxID=32002 RepID=UPI0023E40542|nr:YeeE/YedE family protein [Achromobacter denitrificans]MDF3939417.1 YeeE/YedE family protein [Achromobacter denitrificans]
MNALFAFVSGLAFGLGLIVSGMANPAKVLGFLDLAGAWDPSLAFVMGGAVLITAIGFAVLRRRRASLSGEPMHWPTATRIDRRLAVGSLVFGAGWGLGGFCPGPALVAASAGVREALVFVAAMLAGMAIFSILQKIRSR